MTYNGQFRPEIVCIRILISCSSMIAPVSPCAFNLIALLLITKQYTASSAHTLVMNIIVPFSVMEKKSLVLSVATDDNVISTHDQIDQNCATLAIFVEYFPFRLIVFSFRFLCFFLFIFGALNMDLIRVYVCICMIFMFK